MLTIADGGGRGGVGTPVFGWRNMWTAPYYIFGHQVAQLELVQNLVISWRHLHCFQSWPPWIALLASSVSIELVSSSARVTSVNSSQRCLSLWRTSGPKDRTPGLPGSDKNSVYYIVFVIHCKYYTVNSVKCTVGPTARRPPAASQYIVLHPSPSFNPLKKAPKESKRLLKTETALKHLITNWCPTFKFVDTTKFKEKRLNIGKQITQPIDSALFMLPNHNNTHCQIS